MQESEKTISIVKDGLQVPVFCMLGLTFAITGSWCGLLAQTAPAATDPTIAFYLPGIVTFVVFFGCAIGHRRIHGLEVHGSLFILIGALACLGRLLDCFGGFLGGSPGPVYAGMFLYSSAEALLLLFWLTRCARVEPRLTRIVFPLAYLLAGCLFFVLSELDGWVVAALLGVFPLVSGCMLAAFLARAGESSHFGEEAARPVGNAERSVEGSAQLARGAAQPVNEVDATDKMASGERPSSVSWSFPFRPVVLLVIYKFVFYASLPFTTGPSSNGPLGIIVITVIALVGTTFFFDRYSPSLLYKLALPFMCAGLLMVAWLNTGSGVATLLSNAGNIGFELFILMTLSEVCFRYDIDGIWMFGIVEGFSSLAATIAWSVGGAYVSRFPVGTFGANVAIAVVIIALIAASTLFFNDRMVGRTFGTEPVKTKDAEGAGAQETPTVMSFYEELVWRCSLVARRYGLTHREEEVLALLAQGMSVARIEQDLCITESTAKTHVHHVYEKLGVHSRDEARAIVEDAGKR